MLPCKHKGSTYFWPMYMKKELAKKRRVKFLNHLYCTRLRFVNVGPITSKWFVDKGSKVSSKKK